MPSFNWVHARSECSLSVVFIVLAEVIDSDVKAATALNRPGATFKLRRDASDKLVVTRERILQGATLNSTVIFELLADRIRVSRMKERNSEPAPFFTAAPNLNRDGECLLDVDGEPNQLWQVSRKALEDLFFGGD